MSNSFNNAGMLQHTGISR